MKAPFHSPLKCFCCLTPFDDRKHYFPHWKKTRFLLREFVKLFDFTTCISPLLYSAMQKSDGTLLSGLLRSKYLHTGHSAILSCGLMEGSWMKPHPWKQELYFIARCLKCSSATVHPLLVKQLIVWSVTQGERTSSTKKTSWLIRFIFGMPIALCAILQSWDLSALMTYKGCFPLTCHATDRPFVLVFSNSTYFCRCNTLLVAADRHTNLYTLTHSFLGRHSHGLSDGAKNNTWFKVRLAALTLLQCVNA